MPDISAARQRRGFALFRRLCRRPCERRDDSLTPPPILRHDLLVQLLVHHLDGAVDLGIGGAKLVRDQLYQQVDALDEGRAGGRPPRAAEDGFSRLSAAWRYLANGPGRGGIGRRACEA